MSKLIASALALLCLLAVGTVLAAKPKQPKAKYVEPEPAADDSPQKKEMFAWLKSNCDTSRVEVRRFLSDLQRLDDREVTVKSELPSTMMKSGKPAEVWLYQRQFFAFPLTKKQFELMALPRNEIGWLQSMNDSFSDPTSDKPGAKLSNLKFDKAEKVESRHVRKIKGSVSYKRLNNSSGLTLVLTYQNPANEHVSFQSPSNNYAKDGTLHFDFQTDLRADAEPLAMFVGLYKITPVKVANGLYTNQCTLFSNLVGARVDFSEK